MGFNNQPYGSIASKINNLNFNSIVFMDGPSICARPCGARRRQGLWPIQYFDCFALYKVKMRKWFAPFCRVVTPLTDVVIRLSKYHGLPLYEVRLLNDPACAATGKQRACFDRLEHDCDWWCFPHLCSLDKLARRILKHEKMLWTQ